MTEADGEAPAAAAAGAFRIRSCESVVGASGIGGRAAPWNEIWSTSAGW